MRAVLPFAAVMLISCAGATLCCAQSLGELARQQQQRKFSSSQSKARHVITDDDIRSSSSTSTTASTAPKSAAQQSRPSADEDAQSAAELQARIKAQKQHILDIQASMKDLQQQMEPWKTSDCTHILYSDTQRNACDIPQRLTSDYEKAKAQLKAEQTKLEEIQEEARRLGYGSSFYDPSN